MSRREIVPVDAAGGLIYRKNDSEAPEVVMIYRWGKWDLPKGKREKNESIADCAAREVSEELGIKRPKLSGNWHVLITNMNGAVRCGAKRSIGTS